MTPRSGTDAARPPRLPDSPADGHRPPPLGTSEVETLGEPVAPPIAQRRLSVVVLNGSPKGQTSVTVQYVRFLAQCFPQHTWTILDVAFDIERLAEDAALFQERIDQIAAADAVLWAFPLYYMLVPSQYKQFIELIFDRGQQAALAGKPAAVLTTSIHFFDHAAHSYLRAICDDLGMNFGDSYSAEMYDLTLPAERDRLRLFGGRWLRAVERGVVSARVSRPLEHAPWDYRPYTPPRLTATAGKSVAIVTDDEPGQGQLTAMVARLRAAFAGDVILINLHKIKIRGGCMGCLQCSLDNTCAYRDSDDVLGVYARLTNADILILAGSIRDRYLSARWKLFFDRGFFNNHVPLFAGKQFAFLIAGPLAQLENLRQILETYVSLQQGNLVGIVTDEVGTAGGLDAALDDLAAQLVESAVCDYRRPPTFLAVAGAKLLRDAIWAKLRLVFQADHRYYKRHGRYDFPRRSLLTRLGQGLMSLALKIPAFRREFRKRLKSEMIKPLERVLEETRG